MAGLSQERYACEFHHGELHGGAFAIPGLTKSPLGSISHVRYQSFEMSEINSQDESSGPRMPGLPQVRCVSTFTGVDGV